MHGRVHLKTATGMYFGHASRAFASSIWPKHFDGIAPLVQDSSTSSCGPTFRQAPTGKSRASPHASDLLPRPARWRPLSGIVPGARRGDPAATRSLHRLVDATRGVEPAEAREAIAQVRRFIELHGSSRFEPIGGGAFTDIRIVNRAGFREEINTAAEHSVRRPATCPGRRKSAGGWIRPSWPKRSPTVDCSFAAKTASLRS